MTVHRLHAQYQCHPQLRPHQPMLQQQQQQHKEQSQKQNRQRNWMHKPTQQQMNARLQVWLNLCKRYGNNLRTCMAWPAPHLTNQTATWPEVWRKTRLLNFKWLQRQLVTCSFAKKRRQCWRSSRTEMRRSIARHVGTAFFPQRIERRIVHHVEVACFLQKTHRTMARHARAAPCVQGINWSIARRAGAALRIQSEDRWSH
mmetsp:Transcript_52670/g.101691  ORF Transcript_52670/g.101691 Transcript_52670/m.101691 type:complete len:201 (+) Transcript_52670:190-792(+)